MMAPRLALMARLAGSREVARDPIRVAEMRETYRYLAAVARTLIPELEPDVLDLPAAVAPDAPIEERVAFQMALVKRTNRLHRAVEAHLARRANREAALVQA